MTSILTTNLTDEWGHDTGATVSWMPLEVTGYSSGNEAIGLREWAFGSADTPPVRAFRSHTGELDWACNVETYAGDQAYRTVEFFQVVGGEPIVPGSFRINGWGE